GTNELVVCVDVCGTAPASLRAQGQRGHGSGERNIAGGGGRLASAACTLAIVVWGRGGPRRPRSIRRGRSALSSPGRALARCGALRAHGGIGGGRRATDAGARVPRGSGRTSER